MAEREIPVTRIALLDLKDQQRLVQEGYSLLDEKRILLATEIRRGLEQLRVRRAQMQSAQEAARAAVIVALLRHGLDALAAHPPSSLSDLNLTVLRTRLLGLQLIDASVTAAEAPVPRRLRDDTSDAIRECVHAHRALLASAVALAACSLTLRRLVREYVRTERRTRAIENILLPEINAAVKLLEEQLESMDLEELARLRGRCGLRAGLANWAQGAESTT
ncbi:MAG TPA: V-type ATP synthase subunit D [Steroidobacteraceae bacterium]